MLLLFLYVEGVVGEWGGIAVFVVRDGQADV